MIFVSRGNKKNRKERGLVVYGHEINELNIFSAEATRDTEERIMHAHPNGFEIVFVIKGEMNIETPEKEITLKTGDLLYCPPGLMHRAKAKKGTITVTIRNDTKKIFSPSLSFSSPQVSRDPSSGNLRDLWVGKRQELSKIRQFLLLVFQKF